MSSDGSSTVSTDLPYVENPLTQRFLAYWEGKPPARLPDLAQQSGLPLGGPMKRYLTRPVFLEAAQQRALEADLLALMDLLFALPARLFGGDIAAMATAVGLQPPQVEAVVRTASERPVKLGRADMFDDGERLKLVEFNISSALGGWDTGASTRWLLQDPDLSAFLAAEGLTFVDPLEGIRDIVDDALAGLDAPSRPVIAIVDWPSSFETFAPDLILAARCMDELGFEAIACDTGQLRVRDGHLYVDDRHVDVVHRYIQLGDLLEGPDAFAAVEPIISAAERGTAALVTGFSNGVFASKQCLALLHDDANRTRFTAEENALVDRVLPWTRTLRTGETTVDGERVDLLDYVRADRERLVLKPNLLHGGMGVVPGWKTDDRAWADAVRDALGGSFVVQRRIGPVAERFAPLDPGAEADRRVLNWGVFVAGEAYGGAFVRAVPDPDPGIISMGRGAACSPCFFPRS